MTRPDGSIERAALDHPHADRAAFVASALSVTGPAPPRMGAVLAPVLDRRRGRAHPARPPGPAARRTPARAAPVPRRPSGGRAARGADHGRGQRARHGGLLARHPAPIRTRRPTRSSWSRFAERVGALVRRPHARSQTAWIVRERARRADSTPGSPPQPLGRDVRPARRCPGCWPTRTPTRRRSWCTTPTAASSARARPTEQTARLRDRRPDRPHVRGRGATRATSRPNAENFARLASGELDYHDFHANRRRSDGVVARLRDAPRRGPPPRHEPRVRHLGRPARPGQPAGSRT